jgi:diketogulonate reductase-like aldo/keto reductase
VVSVECLDQHRIRAAELVRLFESFTANPPRMAAQKGSTVRPARLPLAHPRASPQVVPYCLLNRSTGRRYAGLAQGRRPETVEEEALRTGISLGMTLIDTAEVYGNGRSEKLIGRVIAGQRDGVFLVSKVWPSHVTGNGIARACEASLARLGANYLDLFLLHWPQGVTNLAAVVADFERLRVAGKIRAWGVSNFTVSDMEDLFRVPDGDHCATNQVLYNIGSRDIEQDLLPWCELRGMPVMAYTPLGGYSLRDPTLARIGAAHGCSAAAVALAWTTRSGNVIAIPESGSAVHVKENAVALSLTLTPEDLQTLDAAHPPPSRYVLGLRYWTRRVLRALSRPSGE